MCTLQADISVPTVGSDRLLPMASSLCSALGTDKIDLVGQLLAVEEYDDSDANFVVTSLMVQQLQRDGGICLLALHNTFSHYQNVIMKLSGCNLLQLQEKGQVEVIAVLDELSSELDSSTGEGVMLGLCSKNRECIVRNVFHMMKNKIEVLLSKRNSVCLVIDDLSDFLSLGVPLKDIFLFVRYCRTLLSNFKGVSLVILSHLWDDDDEQRLLAAGLAYGADIVVKVAPLVTGRSNDVSGTLKVKQKKKDSSASQQWNQQNTYHFKLKDRQVKLFAPGTSSSMM